MWFAFASKEWLAGPRMSLDLPWRDPAWPKDASPYLILTVASACENGRSRGGRNPRHWGRMAELLIDR